MPSLSQNNLENITRSNSRQKTAPIGTASLRVQNSLANESFGQVRASSPLYLQTEPDVKTSSMEAEIIMQQTFGVSDFLLTEGDCQIEDSLEVPQDKTNRVFNRKNAAKYSQKISPERLSHEEFVVKRPTKNKIQFTRPHSSRALISSLRSKQISSFSLKSQQNTSKKVGEVPKVIKRPIERLTHEDDFSLDSQDLRRIYSQTPQCFSARKDSKMLSERLTDADSCIKNNVSPANNTLLDPLKKYTLFIKNSEEKTDSTQKLAQTKIRNIIASTPKARTIRLKGTSSINIKPSLGLRSLVSPRNDEAVVTLKNVQQDTAQDVKIQNNTPKRPNSRVRLQEAVLKKLFNL